MDADVSRGSAERGRVLNGTKHRARVAIIGDNDAGTVGDCLDGLAMQSCPAVDMVVVDLESADGTADIAIRHPLPSRVLVTTAGDLNRVVDAAMVDFHGSDLLLLRADRRPEPGWLDAALRSLERAALVFGPDRALGNVGLRRFDLGHVQLFNGASGLEEVIERVEAAGERAEEVAGMATAAAQPGTAGTTSPLPVGPPLPAGPAYEEVISIVVSTRGRPDSLRRCLASVAGLQDDAHEVVLVDNNDQPSVDVALLPPRARLVHEPRRGLSAARNRGIAEAVGEVVAFIDDDCEVDPHWLTGLRRPFADPQVAAVTGRVRPASLGTDAARWFEFHFSFDRGTDRRRFTRWDRRPWLPMWPGSVGAGCNMAFRSRSLTELDGFDESLGMGTAIGGGEDLDVFGRLLGSGGTIEYTPEALVWHHHRDNTRDAVRQFWGYGVAVGALLTKIILERPGMRIAACRFFVHRISTALHLARRRRTGGHVLPTPMVIVDLLGQFVGPFVYLASRRRSRSGGT